MLEGLEEGNDDACQAGLGLVQEESVHWLNYRVLSDIF